MTRMTKAQLESQVTVLSTTLQVREREIAERLNPFGVREVSKQVFTNLTYTNQ